MTARIVLAALFYASLTWAGAATAPTTQPLVEHPTTAPAAQSARKFPTPTELLQRMKQAKSEEEKQPKKLQVAYFELSGAVTERPADFSFFVTEAGVNLRSLLDRLHQAREDQSVRAVLLNLESPGFNLAQAQEIREGLADLRRAGKKTFVYADSYDTVTYTIATGATNICMLGGGQVMIPGIGAEAMFAKGLLDKIGVQADYVQVGEYKGADEQFTRTAPSEELRGEMNKLLDALYDQIVAGISLNRNLTK